MSDDMWRAFAIDCLRAFDLHRRGWRQAVAVMIGVPEGLVRERVRIARSKGWLAPAAHGTSDVRPGHRLLAEQPWFWLDVWPEGWPTDTAVAA